MEWTSSIVFLRLVACVQATLEILTENPDAKIPDQLRAIEMILDRAYGKPHVVEVTTFEIEDLSPLAELLR